MNARLDLKHVTRVAEYAPRILAAERASRKTLTKPERERALGWYRVERARMESIAAEVRAGMEDMRSGRYGYRPITAETVIAAAATLSPATSWAHLVVDLPSFVHAALDGDPIPPFATYGAQRRKAATIVRDRREVSAVTGPKVSAFARALAGDTSAVVVDRHAARIALGDDRITSVPLSILRAVQDAYILAASRIGVNPADLQALVWVARVGFGGEYGPEVTS